MPVTITPNDEMAAVNHWRLELIRQQYASGLNEAEERELAALQTAVAKALEPWDRELSEKLEPYETLATQLTISIEKLTR